MITNYCNLASLCMCFVLFQGQASLELSHNATVVFKMPHVVYDWPNETAKEQYYSSGNYIIQNNIVTGIKVHNNKVFVTVPRWKQGVPSTLNVIKQSDDNGGGGVVSLPLLGVANHW